MVGSSQYGKLPRFPPRSVRGSLDEFLRGLKTCESFAPYRGLRFGGLFSKFLGRQSVTGAAQNANSLGFGKHDFSECPLDVTPRGNDHLLAVDVQRETDAAVARGGGRIAFVRGDIGGLLRRCCPLERRLVVRLAQCASHDPVGPRNIAVSGGLLHLVVPLAGQNLAALVALRICHASRQKRWCAISSSDIQAMRKSAQRAVSRLAAAAWASSAIA